MLQTTVQSLKAKKNSKKGFTLMEMLIVVAIIGVLVAISIPVFSAQLETSREAVDTANMRAAKAEALVTYLDKNAAFTGYYDAVNGAISDTTVAAYGKGTTSGTDGTDHTTQIIKVEVNNSGVFTGTWVAGS